MGISGFQHTPGPAALFGVGAASTVGDKTPFKKLQRLLVLSDAGVAKAGPLEVVTTSLGERVIHVDTGVVVDGDTAHVEALAARAKDLQVDGLVAVGGGSVIDSAKGVLAVMATGKTMAALDGIATVRTKCLPLLAIPTTAGTGSEATQFCVVKDQVAAQKRILVDQALIPSLAVLDPALLVGLPAAVAAATAVDALTHAVEAIASRMANPIATALATEALRRLLVDDALTRVLKDGGDVDARADSLIAAHLAGQAISSAMLGATHALGHVVGVTCNLPHGVANGLFVVDVMEANCAKAAGAYGRAAIALGLAPAGSTDAAAAAALIAAVETFVFTTASLPKTLQAAASVYGKGVSAPVVDDLPAMAQGALKDPDLPTNPVRLDEAALLQILRARW